MAVRLTDAEVAQLLEVAKPFPADFRSKLRLRSKRGHVERQLATPGEDGSQFKLFLSQSVCLIRWHSQPFLVFNFLDSNEVYPPETLQGRGK